MMMMMMMLTVPTVRSKTLQRHQHVYQKDMDLLAVLASLITIMMITRMTMMTTMMMLLLLMMMMMMNMMMMLLMMMLLLLMMMNLQLCSRASHPSCAPPFLFGVLSSVYRWFGKDKSILVPPAQAADITGLLSYLRPFGIVPLPPSPLRFLPPFLC